MRTVPATDPSQSGRPLPAKILLVEDEPQLLELLQKYLSRLSFEVDAFARAKDAWSAFEAAIHRYDLVIADLGIPDMSGDTLLTKMLGLNPNLSILICSGSPFSTSSLPDAAQGQVGFLQKPFSPKMLGEAIGALLKRRIQNPE